jgi:hypothetical protein
MQANVPTHSRHWFSIGARSGLAIGAVTGILAGGGVGIAVGIVVGGALGAGIGTYADRHWPHAAQ